MASINTTTKKILLTEEGYKDILEEYKDLTEVQRPAVVDQIKKARELGDLSENGMYSAAREKQSFIEGRIRELEELMKNAEVVKGTNGKNNEVDLDTKVELEMPKQNIQYHIVGAEEVDFEKNKISHESPLGQALMGKQVGDLVEYQAPVGVITYKILSIN